MGATDACTLLGTSVRGTPEDMGTEDWFLVSACSLEAWVANISSIDLTGGAVGGCTSGAVGGCTVSPT